MNGDFCVFKILILLCEILVTMIDIIVDEKLLPLLRFNKIFGDIALNELLLHIQLMVT